MTTVTIEVPFKPEPKGRPRFTRFGNVYTPQKTAEAEMLFQQVFLLQNVNMITEPCRLQVVFHLKRPKSAKGRKYPSVKPDLDNYLKMIMDAANGILYEDDKLICAITAAKIYSDKECVDISISTLE